MTSTPPAGRKVTGDVLRDAMLTGIFLILLTAALRVGAGLLLPVAIALLFTLLLDQPVRALKKAGLPTGYGAALVVFGTLGVLSAGIGLLAAPAADWIEKAPRTLTQVQTKIRRIMRPLEQTAQKVEQATETTTRGGPQTVQIKPPGLLQRVSGSTSTILATTITVTFLTYFLLASLPVFRKKIAELIGSRAGARNMEQVLGEIETQMSRYMLLNTLTSLGVGLATWGFLQLVGLPNSLLWGVLAFFMNFVGAAALVSFDDTGRVLLVLGGLVAINIVEGNFVTPHLMGRHLPLNPVTIFLSLLYWGWVWGPVGTLLAVPITVMLQVVFSNIEPLKPVAVLLDRDN
jgi:predicted PurR-regulated permease PerM